MTINIISCGGYLPEKVIENDEIEKRLHIEKGWIQQRTGILKRHHIGNENFIDCCKKAAIDTLQKTNLNNDDIDLIIIATTTPHQIMPSSAVLLQKALNIKHCMSFDIQAACNGFIYTLILAESMMKSNGIKHALVLGCDAFSSVVNQDDPITACLFGDGFGGVILSQKTDDPSRGIFYTNVGSNTDGADDLFIPWGVAQGHQRYNKENCFVNMNGKEVFKSAVRYGSAEIRQALDVNNLTIDDISCIIPHQANSRIIKSIADNLQISIDKCHLSVSIHGNTSAASIPLALYDWLQGRVRRGNDIILLTGFGAGYIWGTVICEL